MALAMSQPWRVDIDQILEIFMLTRGVKDVVMVYGEVISKSSLGPILLGYETLNDAEIILPDSIYSRLKDLTKLIESACYQEQVEPCKEAVARLEVMYRVVAYHEAKDNLRTGKLLMLRDRSQTLTGENIGHLYSWMTSVPNDFVSLVRDSTPAALVILADFVASTLTVESASYMRN